MQAVGMLLHIYPPPHGSTARSRPGPPHYRGLSITHTHTHHCVGLWMSDRPDAETSS